MVVTEGGRAAVSCGDGRGGSEGLCSDVSMAGGVRGLKSHLNQ